MLYFGIGIFYGVILHVLLRIYYKLREIAKKQEEQIIQLKINNEYLQLKARFDSGLFDQQDYQLAITSDTPMHKILSDRYGIR